MDKEGWGANKIIRFCSQSVSLWITSVKYKTVGKCIDPNSMSDVFVSSFSSCCLQYFYLSLLFFSFLIPGDNACRVNNGGCSTLCLAIPGGRMCACADNQHLEENSTTCMCMIFMRKFCISPVGKIVRVINIKYKKVRIHKHQADKKPIILYQVAFILSEIYMI